MPHLVKLREQASIKAVTLLCAALLAWPATGFAHHSVSMFEREHTVTLHGEVKEFQWTNPHSWIQVLVKDADGNVVEWSLEGGSPGIMGRNGWKRTSLQPGEEITVEIYPLKTGEAGGCFVEITKADGSKLYYHG
ncbi:MAG TPA: DUF6152 family protein [Candidatus Acidoferrum sp.]|nr:DUF6152 family protein [Candidatus Acidoferrum sp.]